MTRKDILKKYGFSWRSNVNLKEELSEQAAAETGWKKRMYNQFMKGADR